METKKYFFGWTNIKKFIMEIIKIYSNQNSFFSKKRIESAIAFIIAQWAMIYFLIYNMPTLSVGDFAIWVGIEFAVAGYIIFQIQKEKKLGLPDIKPDDSTDDSETIK